jgi:hypothetical protein
VDRNPFDSIESAQEYLRLLAEAVKDAQVAFDKDVAHTTPLDERSRTRRLEATQLVTYKLTQLTDHINASCSVLNDLRTLRRLLLGERTVGLKP